METLKTALPTVTTDLHHYRNRGEASYRCTYCNRGFLSILRALPGGEAVQTGSDVLAVVVHLLAVGGALLLQTGQSLLQPQRVGPAPLAVQALVADVLA